MNVENCFKDRGFDINSVHKGSKNKKNIKKYFNQFKHIDVLEYWYDGEDENFNNWIDVEGIGYGWLWTRYEKSKKKQRKLIIKFAVAIYKDKENDEYYFLEKDNVVRLFIVSQKRRCFTMISLSNKELYLGNVEGEEIYV